MLGLDSTKIAMSSMITRAAISVLFLGLLKDKRGILHSPWMEQGSPGQRREGKRK
jgi:hypothetical protein